MLLEENLLLWDYHQRTITRIEKQIETLLDEMGDQKQDAVVEKTPSAPSRHHNPQIKDLHSKMIRQFDGVNLTSIAGINDATMLRLLGETGSDMSRFPTVKHFVSRLGLSPKNKQSGKMKRRVKSPKGNYAGEIFRQSAQSLSTGKHNAIGGFIRRLKGRKGAQVAVKAGARKIAVAFYNALRYGMDYVEAGTAKYQQQFIERELKLLRKLAEKHNVIISECQMVT
jgi:transposase